MIVADTNIWARAMLQDDAAQARRSHAALAEAQADRGVFVPLVVLAELAWVLRARWDRENILTAFEGMIGTQGILVESPAIVEAAIRASRAGNGGFTDHLIAQVGLANGATEIVTFDEKFGKAAKVRRLR